MMKREGKGKDLKGTKTPPTAGDDYHRGLMSHRGWKKLLGMEKRTIDKGKTRRSFGGEKPLHFRLIWDRTARGGTRGKKRRPKGAYARERFCS